MTDTKKMLFLVAGIAVVLGGGIFAAVQIGKRRFLDDAQVKQQVADIRKDLEAAGKHEAKERRELVRALPKTVAKRDPNAPMSEEVRKEIFQAYRQLGPEEKELFLQLMLPEVFKADLAKFNAEHKTPEARKTAIGEMVGKVRADFDKRSDDDLWKTREQMETQQGKAYLQSVQKFYGDGLSSKERSEWEPLMREMLRQVDVLLQLKDRK